MKHPTVMPALVVVAAAAFQALLPACVPLPAVMLRTPRTIRLVDSDTERPVEGAVILRSWHKCDAAAPAGGGCSDFAFREGRSDAEGRAWFPPMVKPYLNLILLPFVWWNWTEEKPILIFKPGYQTVIATPGMSSFRLERIPDSYWRRSEEAERARGYGYLQDLRATRLLAAALEKEEEELKQLPKDVPGVFYHEGISPPPQGGSIRFFDLALDARGRSYLAANGPPSVSILASSGMWTGVKVEHPFGGMVDALASDETGRVFGLWGDKVLRFKPDGLLEPVGTIKGRTARFFVHGRDIFSTEKQPDYANPNPPRAVPIVYHYQRDGAPICQSAVESDLIFRDLAVATDGGSMLVMAENSSPREPSRVPCGSVVIRYDLACRKVSACRLPNTDCDDPAMSVAPLPQGGFIAATEDSFSVYDEDCALVFEQSLKNLEMGRVSICRVRVNGTGDTAFFLDRHYARVLSYDLTTRVFPTK